MSLSLTSFIIGDNLYHIRAPWHDPLFSERYGYVGVIKLGFGWRITRRKLKEERND